MTAPAQQIQIPSGMVTVTTHGAIEANTYQTMMDMRAFSEKQGLGNVHWTTIPGTLVEKARNDSIRQMLAINAQWLLFLDADMVPNPDCLIRLLQTAYGTHPFADVVGAWCPLRGDMSLPTIDTGTGTWESHFPGSGVKEVMRTGGACLLLKRHVFERMPEPWFRMRVPARPIDFMAEFDNFLRMKFNGENPFRNTPERFWERAEDCARQDPSADPAKFVPVEVGEDSGFCDRARFFGLRIFVDTNVEVGHMDRVVRRGSDHKRAMDDIKKQHRLLSGMTA